MRCPECGGTHVDWCKPVAEKLAEAETDEEQLREALAEALNGWERCTTCVVDDHDEIEAERERIAELRKLVTHE